MKKKLTVKERHEKRLALIRKKIEAEKKQTPEQRAEKNYLIELLHNGNKVLKIGG